jgi:hypothetical protein
VREGGEEAKESGLTNNELTRYSTACRRGGLIGVTSLHVEH